MSGILKTDKFVTNFFDTAEKLGYKIDVCKRGSARGKKQIDFGNKKLHELYIRDLYPLLLEEGTDFSYEAFDKIVP